MFGPVMNPPPKPMTQAELDKAYRLVMSLRIDSRSDNAITPEFLDLIRKLIGDCYYWRVMVEAISPDLLPR